MITEIQKWIDYIQIPQSNLDNFPVCPYAKSAIVNNKVQILSLDNLSTISDTINSVDIEKYWVTIIYFLNYEQFTQTELSDLTSDLNKEFNVKDKIILENDPRDPFFINGVKTTFDGCYLFLVQSLADLNSKSQTLQNTTYYKFWTQKGLDEVVNWRKK